MKRFSTTRKKSSKIFYEQLKLLVAEGTTGGMRASRIAACLREFSMTIARPPDSYERGNADVEFHEIGEDEADRIVERIRRTGAERPERLV